jgi:hypothetical protein
MIPDLADNLDDELPEPLGKIGSDEILARILDLETLIDQHRADVKTRRRLEDELAEEYAELRRQKFN